MNALHPVLWYLLLAAGLLGHAGIAKAQCTANAGNDVSICQGQSVTLGGNPTAVNAGGGVSYSWNNGAASTANPSVTPSATTTYTVTLTGGGCNSEQDQVTVTVLTPPVPSFSANPSSACAGTPVNFVNTTSSCPGCTYAWNFGNPASGSSNTSTAQQPSHSFVALGNGSTTFTVSLTVTASNGCTATTTSDVSVSHSPNAILAEDVNFTQCIGAGEFYAYVTNQSTGTVAGSTYSVTWGDGSPGYSSTVPPASVEHIYVGINIWTLTYTVTNPNGCSSTQTHEVSNITNPAIGVGTQGNTLQCGPVEFCFPLSNYQSNHPSTVYLVNYGDGSAVETIAHPPNASICHTYGASTCTNSPPYFTFSITADNNCTPSTGTISPIQIYLAPQAQFTMPPAACVNTAVPFTNTSTVGYNQGCNANANYVWDFGDPASGANNTSTLANPTHVYSAPGTYTVRLTASNAGNPVLSCGSTIIEQTICIEQPPAPVFTVNSSQGCVPMSVTTNNTSSTSFASCNTQTNWTVNYAAQSCAPNTGAFSFTGGTSATSISPQVILNSAGTYTLQLQMTNSCGAFPATQQVVVNTIPQVSVSATAQVCAGSTVTPSATVNGCGLPVTSYSWSLPGGSPSTSNQQNPGAVTFSTPGNYTLGLTAQNACGPATSNAPVQVLAPPNVILSSNSPNHAVCAGSSLTLSASGAGSYSWQPSTGLSNTTGNQVVASPSSTTTYTVTGTSGTCTDQETITVTVQPLPQLAASGTFVMCSGQTTQLGVNVTGGQAPYSGYSWNNAGTLSQSTIANPVSSATSSLVYNVQVTDANGCSGSGNVPLTVHPLPVVNAGPDIQLCNQPVATNLTGYSPVSGGTGVWSGTGVTSSGVFTPTGVGSVTLQYCFTVAATGCVACDQRTVDVIEPQQADAGPDLAICLNAPPVQLASNGTWQGSTLVGSSGVFTPSTVGSYTLTFTTGVGSCQVSDQLVVTVLPLPVAQAGPDVTVCLGTTVSLSGSGTSPNGAITGYFWSGGGLMGQNQNNLPVTPGTTTSYNLVVVDEDGCSGYNQMTVFVNPLPAVNAGPDIQLCNQPVATNLTGYSPVSGGTGVWSGTGVTSSGVFTPTGVGSVTLQYCFTVAATGCVACDQRTVDVIEPQQADAGPDLAICLNAPPVQLASNGTWQGSTLVGSSGVFTPSTVGSYTLTFTTGVGSCQVSDQLVATVLPLPVAQAGPDVTVCFGTTVSLSGSGTSPNGAITGYFWSGGGLMGQNQNNVPVTPGTTTTYNLTVVDEDGCSGYNQMTVFVNPLPVVNAGPDQTLCNQPVPVALNPVTPASGGQWSGPGVTPDGTFTPSATGTVTLNYSYTNPLTGCSNSDALILTISDPMQADAGPDVQVCQGTTPVQLQPPVSGGTWSPQPVSTGGLFVPNTPGTYNLIYTIGAGTCLTQDAMVFTVHSLPTAQAGPDVEICLNESTVLPGSGAGGSGVYQYSWSPSTGLNSPSQATPTASPASTTVYTLTITDSNTCQATDQVQVAVNSLPVVNAGPDIVLCDQPIQHILTGFSPISGGTGAWSGPGIQNPSGVFVSPGVGVHTVTYTFTIGANQCQASDQINITVQAPIPAIAGPDVSICLNEGLHSLTGFSPPTGGTWSGLGIINSSTGIFNPEISGPGLFQLTLQVGTGTCATSDNLMLQVIAPPVVSSLPQQSVCGNAGSFALQNYSPANGGIWEGTGITNATTGIFNPAVGQGNYTLLYHYTDPVTGCADSVNRVIVVHPAPVAGFTVAPMSCTNAPLVIQNTSTGATGYSWNFGSGPLVQGQSPVYTYPNADDHVIELIASNGFGCQDTMALTTEVIHPPIASFALSGEEGCAPLQVAFTNQSVGEYLTYAWDFGYGPTSSDASPPAVSYPQEDDVVIYQAELVVSNFCGTDSDTANITVYPQPVAMFGTDLDVFCSPFTVNFNNNSVGNPDIYLWDFGDGGPTASVEEPGSHVFFAGTEPVDYTIWLHLSNDCGSDAHSHTITVLPNTVNSFFNTDITWGCSPLMVNFTDFSDGATTVQYDFGSGNSIATLNTQYTFVNPGEYVVYHYADNGCSFDTSWVNISVYPSPINGFTTDSPVACAGAGVQFTSLTGNAVGFLWDFGDGVTSQFSNPVHTYAAPGTYQVTLVGTSGNGCTSQIVQPITVLAGPDAAISIPSQVGCSPYNACFTNTTQGGTFYTWDFGNGNTSNQLNPCFNYVNFGAQPQLITVSLIAQNMQLCADTATIDLIIAPQPVSAFSLGAGQTCYLPALVSPQNLSQFANGFEWQVNNVAQSTLVSPTFEFDATGLYQIQLTVSNQFGCSHTSQQVYAVHPLPFASFIANETEGCIPLEVEFTNTSEGASQYIWLFGDGTSSTDLNPVYTYETPGTYSVGLVVITTDGCQDTLVYSDYIQAWPVPSAAFAWYPEVVDIYRPLYGFVNESEGATSSLWNFGDGTSSTLTSLAHYFPDGGHWNVTLQVWNTFGCTSVITETVYVEDIFNIYVPNAITPNDDGVNEFFKPEMSGKRLIERYHFQVFDRWGTVIFETRDPDEAWIVNVRRGNHYARDEVYNWRAEIHLKGAEGSEEFRGHVVVVR